MMLDVAKSATNVTIDGLTFTSIYDKDAEQTNMPHGIHTSGTLITIRNNTFLHVGYAINNNGNPNGVYILDNAAPQANALRAYFSWTQGTNFAIVGNRVVNSTREHNIRVNNTANVMIAYNDLTNADRSAQGDVKDFSKGTITYQRGQFAYIAHNELHDGAVGIGPLGGGNGLPLAGYRTKHVVFEANDLVGHQLLIYHGAENTVVRDNEIHYDNGNAIWVQGWNNPYNRGVVDLVIDHNVVVNDAASGNFLWLAAHATGLIVTNNVYVAPKFAPGAGTAALRIDEGDLSSFSRIDGNVWPSADRGNRWANGGINSVGDFKATGSYLKIADWNKNPKVGDDVLADVSEADAMRITPSMLKAAA